MRGYLSGSVRFARADRRIHNRLKQHAELSKQYVAEGMTPEEASKRAFNEITAPKTKRQKKTEG